MRAKVELLAHCGLYCGGCLGYTGVIAGAAQNFLDVLDTYRFGRTAEYVFPEELGDYERLTEMVTFMSGLRCAGVFRSGDEGGDRSACDVRDCCREKGLHACYECDAFESCPKLASLLQALHLQSCVRNMRAIRAMGLEAWLAAGTRHTYWSEDGRAKQSG